jgi:hypothetical protein
MYKIKSSTSNVMLFSHTKSQLKDIVEMIKGKDSSITSCFKKDKLKRLKLIRELLYVFLHLIT